MEFVARTGPRPRRSVAISRNDGAHVAFADGNQLGLRDLQPFEAHYPHPMQPLSTLRTPRCRDARKTWFRPASYGAARSPCWLPCPTPPTTSPATTPSLP